MDDLILFVLAAILIVLVVGLMVAAFAVAAIVAAVCVFGAAMHGFAVTMWRGVVHRGGASAVAGPGEPAFRAYYRGQVWRDVRLAASAGWRNARRETTVIRGYVPSVVRDPRLRVVVEMALAAYGYVGLAVATVLAAVVGIVPALLLGVLALCAWALGAPLRWVENVRRRRTGAYFDCQECHDRFPLPKYLCPNCGARHGELAPGPFGVLSHRCTCGARLPAVPLRGRERLQAECPNGHALGESVGRVRTFHVPVAGGPSTGKSTFLGAALVELEAAASAGALATTVQQTSRAAHDEMLAAFAQGATIPKTSGLPPAVVAEVRGRDRSVLLYAYDVAGETYAAEEELRRDPAHGLADGVVLLVDPFALDHVRLELGDELMRTPGVRPSSESPQRMLERLLGVLVEQGADLSRIPAAVCVTKVDALGVGDAIAAAPGETESARVATWLEAQGAGNFLRAAEDAFAEVGCFSVSALGRTPGTAASGPFVPVNAFAPLLWLLRRAGVEPTTQAQATPTASERIAASKPLDVTPKRPILQTPLDDVRPFGLVRNFAVGAVAVAVLAFGATPLVPLQPSPTDAPSLASVADSSGDGGGESFDEASETTTADANPVASDEESGGASRSNTADGSLRRHFQRLDSGDYEGAFALMDASYRRMVPNWVSVRRAAEPHVDVAEIGSPRFVGNGVAYVPIKFYGRDRYRTAGSDTACRRFEGEARMVKKRRSWRYSPRGDAYEITTLPSNLDVCNR